MTNDLYLKIKNLNGVAYKIINGKVRKLAAWDDYFSSDESFKYLMPIYLKKRAIRKAKRLEESIYSDYDCYCSYTLENDPDYNADKILRDAVRDADDFFGI